MEGCLAEAFENRRSIYQLGNERIVSENRIVEIVEQMVKFCPSAFNSQSGRVAVLLGENHHKLWQIVENTLRKVVPAEKFSSTKEKIDSFDNGYATILFFEDQNVVESLQDRFPDYAHNFPLWSLQSSGMLQYMVWTALENQGLGCSLQHYNPLIDLDVAKEWGLPASWKLISQMPVGSVEAVAGEKSFEPVEKRVKVFK